ncbi:MAG TPA: haloacid dehalogenase type II [Planctomycetaceae bacterium]|nr:haloacid dehalogenase type II [Planctomycetaceae bacterium]
MGRLDNVEILTFDCYGTLVDWESGIRRVLGQLRESHGVEAPVDRLLAEWEEIQFQMIGGPCRPYRDVLRDSLHEAFRRQGVQLAAEEADQLGCTIGDWPLFPDTRPALARLKARYRLGILSNIDDWMLARSVSRMGVEFDELITAEQVQSYKPRPAHFHEAMRRFGAGPEQFLHCAFGLKYDHEPARRSGMQGAWIRRPGWIGDQPAEVTVVVDSLEELAQRLGV